jgi:hypothetical protein
LNGYPHFWHVASEMLQNVLLASTDSPFVCILQLKKHRMDFYEILYGGLLSTYVDVCQFLSKIWVTVTDTIH